MQITIAAPTQTSTRATSPRAILPRTRTINSHQRMHWRDILRLAMESVTSARIRFFLTALGMVIGTASVILVVTIGLTGKRFILEEIQKIGTNEIELEYAGKGPGAANANHNGFLTPEDQEAVVAQLPDVLYSSPVLHMRNRISLGAHSDKETMVLGVTSEYQKVRNLIVPYGRFFDQIDERQYAKCAVVTDGLARSRFGTDDAAIGQEIKINDMPFTVIGVFKESVSDFGESEIASETVLIPYPVARFFTGTNEVKQIYFSMRNMAEVPQATAEIKRIVSERHNPNFIYVTQDLGDVLNMAASISNIIMVVLLLVSAITLVVGGVGIMNIMLANVRARIHEIGLRKALGATPREIRLQFLSEAVLISLSGGLAGCLVGLTGPLCVRLFTDYSLPINLWSIVIALAAACATGVVFGTVPANRAAQLDPIDSLRYE